MKTEAYRETEPGPFSDRRRNKRRKVSPSGATCWSGSDSPSKAVVIEADTKGARLILPWTVQRGQDITVSFANSLGLHRTEKAKIAWTQPLDSSGQTIVGLYYTTALARAA